MATMRGAWVDETVPATPKSERSRERLAAENAWLASGADRQGRSRSSASPASTAPAATPLRNLARGTARRIVKPGQVFNRIHVDDIAAALMASIERPRPARSTTSPTTSPRRRRTSSRMRPRCSASAAARDAFDPAAMSPMAASFYGENKRVSNRLIKQELGWTPAYPSYREGLAALLAAGEGVQAA